MSDTIPRTALQPADVLLYHGKGLIAEAIRRFDGTEVNHAGLYIAADAVAEALGNGLERRTLEVSYGDHDWVRARRLKAPVVDFAPVTARGEAFLAEGHRYAYEQILLLAFLGLTRQLTPNGWLRVVLRSVLDSAATTLERLLAGKRQPMICSEFVYRCYDEALPDREDAYTLHVNVLPQTFAAPRGRARAAAPAAARGRGIHPESLLAWASAPAVRSLAAPRAMGRARLGARRVSAKELERNVEAYLKSAHGLTRAARAARGAPAVSDEELRASVDRFAIAYHNATVKPSRGGQRFALLRGESVSATAASPFTSLTEAAADFVTPGDLLHTDSLTTMGKIQL